MLSRIRSLTAPDHSGARIAAFERFLHTLCCGDYVPRQNSNTPDEIHIVKRHIRQQQHIDDGVTYISYFPCERETYTAAIQDEFVITTAEHLALDLSDDWL